VALVTFMGIDYLTGLIVAGVFSKSRKSGGGGLESGAGFEGLMKKVMYLLFVTVAVQLDTVIGSDFVRDAVIIAFMGNELISIVENAGMMGVPIPAVISRAIDVLNRKGREG
jgi:toxin secretion/phage lysis holin